MEHIDTGLDGTSLQLHYISTYKYKSLRNHGRVSMDDEAMANPSTVTDTFIQRTLFWKQ